MGSIARKLGLLAFSVLLAWPALEPMHAEDARSNGVSADHALENGVRLTVYSIPTARKQSTFTFLPMGLLSDGPGEEQLSHLLEHLIIRATDPDGLGSESLQWNGETTALALRLDTYCDPERAEESFERHARWITTRDLSALSADLVTREKASIEREVDFTVRSTFTHKWAHVAWNQIVRHGRSAVAIRKAVRDASIRDVEGRLARRSHPDALGRGSDAWIVTAGPMEAQEARRAFESLFRSHTKKRATDAPSIDEDRKRNDKLVDEVDDDAAEGARDVGHEEARDSPVTPPSEVLENVAGSRDRTVTWDLAARHVIEWYEIPDRTPQDRAAAMVVSRLIQMRLFQSRELQAAGVHALASADLITEDGRFLSLSASIPDSLRIETIRSAFRTAIESALEPSIAVPDLGVFIAGERARLMTLPSFGSIVARMRSSPQADLVEAQYALSVSMIEVEARLSRYELAEALGEVDREDLERLIRDHLSSERRASLLLVPATEDAPPAGGEESRSPEASDRAPRRDGDPPPRSALSGETSGRSPGPN